MPVSTFARLVGFHSICYQRNDDLADAFVKRGLKLQILGALQIFWIWPKGSFTRASITASTWKVIHVRHSKTQIGTLSLCALRPAQVYDIVVVSTMSIMSDLAGFLCAAAAGGRTGTARLRFATAA